MRRRASTPSAAERPPAPRTVRVNRIGVDGDGIAEDGGQTFYVPLTLPGELVQITPRRKLGQGWLAHAEDILEPSAERVLPPCPHFGPCGGCSLQHWQMESYARFKSGLLPQALSRAGFSDPVCHTLHTTPPASRRRMDFALRRKNGVVTLGLHERRSDDILDLHSCTILHPRLVALLEPLRPILQSISALKREGALVANLLETGPDLLLRTDGELTGPDRIKIAAFAEKHSIARIAWAQGNAPTEMAAQLRSTYIHFGAMRIDPPPGAFLQASTEGEAAILAAVRAGIPDKLRGNITELYAGCGTFSAMLAEHAPVRAFEGDAESVAALRKGSAGHRITVTLRDLARQPLQAPEFADTGLIVLDPPFAGAASQIGQIATSNVARVIYISCHPAALARDAEILKQAGYALLNATPVDQFLWSSRLESVAVFHNSSARRKRPI